MTHDFAKPSTTKKPGAAKTKKASSGKATKAKGTVSKKASGASAKESVPAAKTRSRTPFFLSLIVLVCAFVYGLYVLQSIPPTKAPEKDKSISKKTPSQTVPKSTEEAQTKRFNFYEILPESTVKTPKVEEYRFKKKSGGEAYSYIIQTGSFKNRADAERQKVNIAFQGLKAKIETVTNDKGTVWHRVKTGPFKNRSKLNSALDKLVSINIQPLVKKVKKDS